MLVVDISGAVMSVGSVFCLTEFNELTEMTYVQLVPRKCLQADKLNAGCIND